ncbi:MAG TPA: DUF1697 domain-containing protein [Telluria sp.]
MTRNSYIALLRGINVGRAKRIAMADLRKLVADLGFADVRSFQGSGNVVFSAASIEPAAAAAAMEEALVLKLGVAARVTVMSCGELDTLIAGNPLVALATDPARLLAFILTNPDDRKLIEPLCAMDWSPGALALGERAAYVWCPAGVLDSAAAAAVGKQLGDATTARNWHTLCKLQDLGAAGPDRLA